MSKYNQDLIEAISSVQSKYKHLIEFTDMNELHLTKKDSEEIRLKADEIAVIVKKISHKIETLI